MHPRHEDHRQLLAVATYGTGDPLKRAFPDLDEEDVRQALEYAAQRLDGSEL